MKFWKVFLKPWWYILSGISYYNINYNRKHIEVWTYKEINFSENHFCLKVILLLFFIIISNLSLNWIGFKKLLIDGTNFNKILNPKLDFIPSLNTLHWIFRKKVIRTLFRFFHKSMFRIQLLGKYSIECVVGITSRNLSRCICR